MNIKHFPQLEQELIDLFNEHDPQGLISMGAPPDEYESEIRMVMERVGQITSIRTAQDVLYQVFVEMFDKKLAGTPAVYTPLASDLYQLLKQSKVVP